MKQKRFVKAKAALLAATMFLGANKAGAGEFNVHGFVAQGVIQADGSNFVNNDGDISPELTELGINASYRINSNLRLSGQAVYLNGGNRFANGAKIDHLFLDWQLYNSLDWQVNLLVGKIKSYHRLHSATRDVPHTRPSIILPQSLYIDVFRDISIGSDGALLRSHFNNGWGEWDLNWNYGEASISGKQTRLFIAPNATGTLSLEREHQGSFLWRPPFSNAQFGGSFVNATFDYDQGENDAFFDGSVKTKGYYLNFRYNSEFWTFTSEVVRFRTITKDLVFETLKSDITQEGVYFEGQYYLSPTVTALARIDLFDRNREDRDGSALQRELGIPSYFGYMDMATLGLSWDFAKNWRLQGEVHRVKGTGRLAPILVPDLENNSNKYWDIWALQVMYWF